MTQQKSKEDLAQWTEYVSETLQSMKATTTAIQDLQNKLATHEKDLKGIEQTKNRVIQLEGHLKEKDKSTKFWKDAFDGLAYGNKEKLADAEKEKERLEQERQEFQGEKIKQEKRVELAMAERKINLEKEFKLRNTKLDSDHEKKTGELDAKFARKKKELEDDFAKKNDEISTRVKALEAENAELSKSKMNLERENKDKDGKLSKATEQCDTLERAKISVHQELQKQKNEIESMKKEFTLNSKSTEY